MNEPDDGWIEGPVVPDKNGGRIESWYRYKYNDVEWLFQCLKCGKTWRRGPLNLAPQGCDNLSCIIARDLSEIGERHEYS